MICLPPDGSLGRSGGVRDYTAGQGGGQGFDQIPLLFVREKPQENLVWCLETPPARNYYLRPNVCAPACGAFKNSAYRPVKGDHRHVVSLLDPPAEIRFRPPARRLRLLVVGSAGRPNLA